MVLIYDGLDEDPRMRRLSDAAFSVWMMAVKACSRHGRDTLGIDELEEAVRIGRPPALPHLREALQEFAAAELAVLLPHDHVRMLARLDLWAVDDEGEATATFPF